MVMSTSLNPEPQYSFHVFEPQGKLLGPCFQFNRPQNTQEPSLSKSVSKLTSGMLLSKTHRALFEPPPLHDGS